MGYVADPAPTGDPSAASFVVITNAKDVNVKFNVDKVDQSDRSSRYKLYCPSMIELEVTATVRYTDATKTFIDSVLNRDTGTVQVLDRAGGEGWYFHCQVSASNFSLPLADGMSIDLTFCPIRTVDFATGEEPKFA